MHFKKINWRLLKVQLKKKSLMHLKCRGIDTHTQKGRKRVQESDTTPLCWFIPYMSIFDELEAESVPGLGPKNEIQVCHTCGKHTIILAIPDGSLVCDSRKLGVRRWRYCWICIFQCARWDLPVCFFSGKAEWQRMEERERRNDSSICWFTWLMPATIRPRWGWSQDSGIPSEFPMLMAGIQVLILPSSVFQDALGGSWIEKRVVHT